jgi:diketogulonate reductase-like aldo/keto reductase
MTNSIKPKTLPSGTVLPRIGLGVYQSAPGDETYKAVLIALKMGYRHIDTAQMYGNECDVGRAIQDSGIPRQDIFITTKLWISNWGYQKAMAAIKESNERLGGTYIDLCLLHAPGNPELRAETWAAMEHLQEVGIIHDIGVSNFSPKHLEKLNLSAKITPCVNQIELHPWLQRREVVDYCRKHDIVIEAYSPLAKASKLNDPILVEIAQQVNATPAQVLIAWSLAKDFVTLPKSVHEERQQMNLKAADVTLSTEQIQRLDMLDENLVTGWDPIKTHAV